MKLISVLRRPLALQHRLRRVVAAVTVVTALYLSLPTLVTAAGPAIYSAFGDSIAFGAFAPIGQGYVPLYARALANDTHVFVSTTDLGVPGWTSADLLSALQNKLLFRVSARASNVITWNIGGNDLSAARNLYKAGACGGPKNEDCLGAAVTTLENNWDGIIDTLFFLRQGKPTIFRTMDIYNPFVAEDLASDSWPPTGPGFTDFDVFKTYLDEVNLYIQAKSMANGVRVAQVYDAFNGPNHDQDPGTAIPPLLAFDDFHPNAAGHALMASKLRGLGYLTVTP
jgi:lysophospholipase L1-like esterase